MSYLPYLTVMTTKYFHLTLNGSDSPNIFISHLTVVTLRIQGTSPCTCIICSFQKKINIFLWKVQKPSLRFSTSIFLIPNLAYSLSNQHKCFFELYMSSHILLFVLSFYTLSLSDKKFYHQCTLEKQSINIPLI